MSKNQKRRERRRRKVAAETPSAMQGASTNQFAALLREDDSTQRTAAAKESMKKKKKTKKKRTITNYRSVVEDNRARIETFAFDSRAQRPRKPTSSAGGGELVLGGDLNALEKRMLADIARGYGLQVAENCGPKRTVRITTPPDWTDRQQRRADEPVTISTMPISLRHRCVHACVVCKVSSH